MASDLHLTLHESNLGVEFAQAYRLEVSICHCESSVSFGGFSFFTQSLAILEINLVNQRWLGTLLCRDLEAKDRVYFGDESLAVATS